MIRRPRTRPAKLTYEAPHGTPSPLREIAGNLVLNDKQVIAWFRLAPTRWSFLTAEQQLAVLADVEVAYTALAGRHLHIRSTTRPYSPAQWGHAFLTQAWTDNEPAARTEPVNVDALDEYARLVQHRMHAVRLGEPEVYLGVTIGTRGLVEQLVEARHRNRPAYALTDKLMRTLRDVTRHVALPGLEGRPATIDELIWLEHKSVGLMLPQPTDSPVAISQGLAGQDVCTFTDGVHVNPGRLGADVLRLTTRGAVRNGAPRRVLGGSLRTGSRIMLDVNGTPTPVTLYVNGKGDAPKLQAAWRTDDGRTDVSWISRSGHVTLAPESRYVAVVTLGRIEDQAIPGPHGPYVARSQRLPFPVEWSIHADALDAKAASAAIRRRLKLIMDQRAQAEGGDELTGAVDAELERVGLAAAEADDRLRNGSDAERVEFHVTYRAAVGGATRDEALDRARQLVNLYKGSSIAVEHPPAQEALYREFDIAAPGSTPVYSHRVWGDMFAAALPTLASHAGDNEGLYLGWTAGTSQTGVMLDLHRAMYEGEASGLVPVVGTLGSGKSVLSGMIAYYSALRGIPTTIWDPSGPLARLCHMPAIRDHAYHLDLLGPNAKPGMLSPFAVIADPARANYGTDETHEDAVRAARRARVALCLDVTRMLLGGHMTRDPRTEMVLSAARVQVRGERTDSLDAFIGVIRGLPEPDAQNGWNQTVANALVYYRDAPHAHLFYGRGEGGLADIVGKALLVITMAGMVLPTPGADEDKLTEAQRIAIPLLHLAANFTSQRIYSGDMNLPKCVLLDETHFLAGWASGNALIQKLGVDSRKHRTVAMINAQNAGKIIGADVANFIGAAFVGRTQSEEEQLAALRLLDAQPTPAHMVALARLSPRTATGMQEQHRHFVLRDPRGNVETVQIDIVDPLLRAALDPSDTSFDQYLPEGVR
jgi:hypothetical protein